MPTPLIATPIIIYPDLGTYCTYAQAVKSDTAIRRGIANTPTHEQYENMRVTYAQIILPLFNHFGRLPISSFFRSPALNKAIGGATNSAHLYGNAVDIDCDGMKGITNKMVFDWARANLDLDQLILEQPDQHNNPAWVHLAYRTKATNRHQVLRMIRQGGKTIYQAI